MPSAINGNGASAHIGFQEFHNIVNNELKTTKTTRHGINPATKKPNPPVPCATRQDLDDAVDFARTAFVKWSKSTDEQRRNALNRFAQALKDQEEEFAQLLIMEQGKPVSDH